MNQCNVTECDNKVKYLRRGMCSKHYYQLWRIPYGNSIVTTEEYIAWKAIIQRCCNQNSPHYKYYMGRGITICDEWRHDFYAFYNHIGPRPTPKHSVDRINNDGNYEPGNVRWATASQQALNKRPRLTQLNYSQHNTSGVYSTTNKKGLRWTSRPYCGKKRTNQGTFDTRDEAVQASISYFFELP